MAAEQKGTDYPEPEAKRPTGPTNPRSRLAGLVQDEFGVDAKTFGEALMNMGPTTTLESVAAKMGVDTDKFVEVAGAAGFSFKNGLLVQVLPGVATAPPPVVSPDLNAAQAMANGTATKDDIRTIEEGTIEKLREAKAQGANGNIDRALGILKADGEITGKEYKVFQALVEKSGVDLKSVGISNAQQIDTTQELGAATTAMIKNQEQGQGRT